MSDSPPSGFLQTLRKRIVEEEHPRGAIASGNELIFFILSKFRENPAIGETYEGLFSLRKFYQLAIEEIEYPDDVNGLIEALEDDPLSPNYFVEISGLEIQVGVLINRYALKPSGYVYVATAFSENASVVGRVEIRACKESPDPKLSFQNGTEFHKCRVEDAKETNNIPIILSVLNELSKRSGVQSVKLAAFKIPQSLVPPEDETFGKLIREVYRDQTSCSIVKVPISMVHPFDQRHCLSFPLEIVRPIARKLSQGTGGDLRPVVYWNGDSFTMSDDYGLYLAYIQIDCKAIEVSVLGHLPPEFEPSITGGQECLPPAMAMAFSSQESDADFSEMIRQRVASQDTQQNQKLGELYETFIGLARIIADPTSPEQEIHSFILEHPIIVNQLGFNLSSELRLGSQYRVDIALRNDDGIENKIQLIELERASLEIFTQKGRPRSHVTHAIQQVEDWLRWWKENPKIVPSEFDSKITPSGMVIIGRSIGLDEERKSRLENLNVNRNIQVITYDDLLTRIEGLMRMLM